MKYKIKKGSLKRTVDKTTTDVINRLKKLEGDDRYALMTEHFETLVLDWYDLEVQYLFYGEGDE
tara:strand:- start:683 stop:874 length:192 start_codon:yes stop_codon:yes gene_type:complete